jgi:hypothetical protein
MPGSQRLTMCWGWRGGTASPNSGARIGCNSQNRTSHSHAGDYYKQIREVEVKITA